MIAIRIMANGKSSPGYEGLKKEFYEQFQDNSKVYFSNSLKQSKINGHLPISQRQATIKLLVKKDGAKNL